MKLQNSVAALAVTLAAVPAMSGAETLVFATTNPEQHPINQGFLIPWAERITAAADGAVEVDIRHGPMLANHTNFYDRVIDDVAQISWGMTIFNPGRFPSTLVSTVPFMVESSEQGSAALCAMYEDGIFDNDFNDIQPLLFVEFPQASIHVKGGTLEVLDDVAGRKLITSSPAAAAIVEQHGGAPLSFSIGEQYEALQRGAADGTILNATAMAGFRLNEVTDTTLIAPLGGAMGVVFMSKDRWNALSPAAQDAIKAESGCDASRNFGQFIDGWEAEAMAMIAAQDGHTVTEATPEQVDALREQHWPGLLEGFSHAVPGGKVLIEQFGAALTKAGEGGA